MDTPRFRFFPNDIAATALLAVVMVVAVGSRALADDAIPGAMQSQLSADGDLAHQVPLFQKYDPNIGPHDNIGVVSSSINSSSCQAAVLDKSVDRIRAINELRSKAFTLGANGLTDLQCYVSGSKSYNTSASERQEWELWQQCTDWYGRDAMKANSEETLDAFCELARGEERARKRKRKAGLVEDEPLTVTCSYTTVCQATAIRREEQSAN